MRLPRPKSRGALQICGGTMPSKKNGGENAEQFADRMNVKFGDKISPQELFQKIERFLGRFVCYPSEHARIAHALWIAHTHCMDAWESTARLAALSPEPASGKTRLLEITALLVPSPIEAVNMSVAYLFRKVGGEDGLPTILFDEIDTVFGPKAKENEETRALLNAGHRRGAVVGRCVTRGKTIEPEETSAFCAVAMAGLGWLPDTLLSRSIIIRMRRRHAGEHIEQYRHRIHSREGHQLRDALAVWAAGAVDELAKTYPDLPESVQDRDADMWEPLVAIADAIGGEWPKLARKAAVSLVSDVKEAEPSLGVRLLTDCKKISGGAHAAFTSVLLKALHEMPEAPWEDLKGKPLNDRGLALRLRQYGIKSKQVRIGDITLKGYEWADFHDAWKRYLPPPPPSDVNVTNETSETGQQSQWPDVSVVSDAPAANVSDVSLVSPVGEGGGVPSDYDAVLEERAAQGLPTSGNGFERGDDPGPIPECLIRRAPNGSTRWMPALGPEGDDVFDIDPKRPHTRTASSSVGRQS